MRNLSIKIRFSEEEMAVLRERSSGIGMSSYIRGLIKADSGGSVSVSEKSTPTELGKGKGVGLSSDAIADMVKRQKDKKR